MNMTSKMTNQTAITQIENIDRTLFSPRERFYLDLYLLEFYTGGISLNDLAGLRNTDIVDDGECLNCSRCQYPGINSIRLNNQAKAILKYYASGNRDEYLLPIFRSNKKNHRTIIQQLEKELQLTLQKVGRMLGYKHSLSWQGMRLAYVNGLIDQYGYSRKVAYFAGDTIMEVAQERYTQGLDRISPEQVEQILA